VPHAPARALHAGEVASDAHGHASKDLNLTFRLLDSDRLRSDLARTQANLALLVSESIYNDIVRQGHRDIDAEAFQPVQVAAKGTYARAWLFLPGRHNRVPNGPGQAVPATVTSSVPREVPPTSPTSPGAKRSWIGC
jgi:hypothetical protein